MEEQEIVLFDSPAIDLHWSGIVEMLKDTPWLLDLYYESDLYELVKTGQFQVWGLNDGMIRAILLTRIHCFPKKKIFEILGVKGSQFEKFFPQITDCFDMIAQSTGCDEIRTVVRPGLEKLLRSRYSRKISVQISRNVDIKGVQ